MKEIQVGDRVRSFDISHPTRDIEGDQAFYTEGLVTSISKHGGIERYNILVDRLIEGGVNIPCYGMVVRYPVNGTTIEGSVSNRVELIQD